MTWWGDFLSDFKIISILVVASSGQTYHLDSWVLARGLALERRKDRCRGKQPASQGKVRQASPSCPEAAAAAWNPAHWPPTQKCPAGLNHTEYDPKVPIQCPERDPVIAQRLWLLLEPCPLTNYTLQGLTKVPLGSNMPSRNPRDIQKLQLYSGNTDYVQKSPLCWLLMLLLLLREPYPPSHPTHKAHPLWSIKVRARITGDRKHSWAAQLTLPRLRGFGCTAWQICSTHQRIQPRVNKGGLGSFPLERKATDVWKGKIMKCSGCGHLLVRTKGQICWESFSGEVASCLERTDFVG